MLQRKNLKRLDIQDEVTDVICEECGRNMVVKYGPHGKFLACPGFPECRNTKPYLEKNRCGVSEVRKRSRYEKDQEGQKIFWL